MANIKLNNKEYTIPDSVLAGPTADFIAHLGTIAGNGLKVVVGGVEYFIDLGKVAGAIAEIEGVLEELAGGAGGLTDITWDGIVGDRHIIDLGGGMILVRVADFVSADDILGAKTYMTNRTNGTVSEFTIEEVDPASDVGFADEASWLEGQIGMLFGVHSTETYEGQEAYAGLYVMSSDYAYISKIEFPNTPDEEDLHEAATAEIYTLAPTALSFRSTAPLNELNEIQINGVTVDPANYTLEEGSTIVTFPIDYLKTLNVGSYEVAVASDSKTVKGDFTVKAPELNEHGFYYNQPYTAYVEAFGGNTAVFIRNNGTLDLIVVEGAYTETCNYTIADNQMTIQGAMGTFTASPTDNGSSMFVNELYTTFVLGDNHIASDADYIYIYKEDLGGYEVAAIDKTKAEYGAIKTGINGIDTVKLADYAFYAYGNTQHMTVVPEMPDSVSIIGEHAFENCYSLMSAVIGNGVTSIGDTAFDECTGLTSVVIGENVTSISVYAFNGCMNLVSISFKGTMAQWDAINFGTAWKAGVPATYVQCSDGKVWLIDTPEEDELGLPIKWNSMEVMGNPSVIIGEMPFVKVSDYAPSTDELNNSTITLSEGGGTEIYHPDNLGTMGNICGGKFSGIYNESIMVYSVSVAEEFAPLGVTFPEAGFYFPNWGIDGIDADFILDLVATDGQVAL